MKHDATLRIFISRNKDAYDAETIDGQKLDIPESADLFTTVQTVNKSTESLWRRVIQYLDYGLLEV